MEYRKKPIVVEAIIFDGTNFSECENYIGKDNYDNTLNYPNIITSEGNMAVNIGDYIIKEPFDKERKFYPCKPDIFEMTYELASTSSQTEISDEEIERFADEELGTIRTDFDFGVIQGMKWYREQVRLQTDKK